MPRSKQKKNAYIQVRLKSIIDLARLCCTFSNIQQTAYSVKQGKGYTMFAIGERVGDSRMAYTAGASGDGSAAVYSVEGAESLELVDTPPQDYHTARRYRIPIVELAKWSFEKPRKEEIRAIRVSDYRALAKQAMARGMEDQYVPHLYAFEAKGRKYLAAFGVMDIDRHALFYAESKINKDFGFLRYSYGTDTLEGTDSFGESQYAYLKLINLKDPFPFFKPE
ncbi:MAG: hypothetical protein KGH98_04230 [Candidatus Micrarchaeota archaeon]|nr:hypothetical protein [Candidatus Micrarchaeota archaeon]